MTIEQNLKEIQARMDKSEHEIKCYRGNKKW